jgi:Uma2 family endonuclease
MFAHISVPETQPATELVSGSLVQKRGGELRHQELRKRWTCALNAWGARRGAALHGWQHEFSAPRHCFAVLVPDVAFQLAETLAALGPEGSEAPAYAPEIAVEILSIGEPELPLDWKIGAYLAAGTKVIFVVDPPRRTVVAHAVDGVTRFGPGETVRHPALPGFAFAIDAMFEGLYLG